MNHIQRMEFWDWLNQRAGHNFVLGDRLPGRNWKPSGYKARRFSIAYEISEDAFWLRSAQYYKTSEHVTDCAQSTVLISWDLIKTGGVPVDWRPWLADKIKESRGRLREHVKQQLSESTVLQSQNE